MSKHVIELNDEQEADIQRKFGTFEDIAKKVVSDCVNECRREDAIASVPEPEQASPEEVAVVQDDAVTSQTLEQAKSAQGSGVEVKP